MMLKLVTNHKTRYSTSDFHEKHYWKSPLCFIPSF